MYEAEFELEAELENLMGILAESDMEGEAEDFAPATSSGIDPLRLPRDQGVIGYHLAQGVVDENQLTDAVFFDRHPERHGRLLEPSELALRREWLEIRALIVRPMLRPRPVSQPPAPSAARGPTSVPWVRKLFPLLSQNRGAVPPSPHLYAGEIPLYVLLGWINVESAGRLEGPTSIGELGYFQLHPEESQSLKLDHSRLRTDPDYSVWGGIQLVRWKAAAAQQRGFPEASELLWRVAKWLHWLPGVVDLFLKDMREAGVEPSTDWNVIEQYVNENRERLNALTRSVYRIRQLGNWEAMVGIRNVNKTIETGKQLAAGLGSQ
jgi:hypothetical protein